MSISPIRPSYTGATDPESDLEALYATLPLGMPLPPAYSPSEASTASMSPMICDTPEYSSQLLQDEVFLDGTPLAVSRPRPGESTSSGSSSAPRRQMQFNTCHNNLKLSLSSRSHHTQTPAYGRNELIEGFVEVLGSLKHIERIDLVVEGMVTTTVIDRGYPISSDSKCILAHRQTLYYSASATVSPEQERGTVASKGRLFPFSYRLPTTMDGSTAPLPPSFYRVYATREGSVRYVMRIEVHKRGMLRRNENRVETVILYLPKTTPPSTRPPSWYHYASAGGSSSSSNPDVKIPIEPASDRSQKEWKTIALASGAPVPGLGVEFSLLKPLVYQARSPIPFSLTVSASSPVLPDLILSCAQVTLLRCTTIHATGQTYQQEEVIGTAEFGKPESPTEGQSQSKAIRVSNGCIEGGKEQGEIAWSVDSMVEVKYALRVDIKPTLALDAAIPTFCHQETIELTTHSAEDADNWDGVLDGPALGIIGRL